MPSKKTKKVEPTVELIVQEEQGEREPSTRGGPSKYDPVYCDAIISFFSEEPYHEVERKKTNAKTGDEYIYFETEPNDLPTFEAFAHNIQVHPDTLGNWCDTYPDFGDAYAYCKALQKNFLMQNAIRGYYPPAFAIFTAKNITDMRDQPGGEGGGVTNNFFLGNVPEDKLKALISKVQVEVLGNGRQPGTD